MKEKIKIPDMTLAKEGGKSRTPSPPSSYSFMKLLLFSTLSAEPASSKSCGCLWKLSVR